MGFPRLFFRSGFPQPRWHLELKGRFGLAIEPREWFLALQPTIREAIEKLMKGTLQEYRYDLETAAVVRVLGDGGSSIH